jgi:hypothetical protein
MLSFRWSLGTISLVLGLLTSGYLATACSDAKGKGMRDLDAIQPLQQLFEQDQGKVRLLILLSPT